MDPTQTSLRIRIFWGGGGSGCAACYRFGGETKNNAIDLLLASRSIEC